MTESEFERVYQRYLSLVYRVSLIYLREPAEAEDAAAEVFVKLLSYRRPFDSETHLKYWLIRTATNQSRDTLGQWWRRRRADVDCDSLVAPDETPEADARLLLEKLPAKYKEVVFLNCCEGFTAAEIAAALHLSRNTVYARLSRGRALLRLELTPQTPTPKTEPEKEAVN